ncbi:hypothetical protein WBG78_01560 [Chryseolinea sp. T2]|uniref:hypothetical protein n=1 Tax=Chryseolinea sp. T2 TaxID=3129255 RepID=UPI003077CD19
MKRASLTKAKSKIAAFLCCICVAATAQYKTDNSAPESSSDWSIVPTLNFYFIPDDFFILPTITADKNKLHLEARYNYEDRETFSVWAGYNFEGGSKLTYTITPMAGGVFGLSNGLAPGLRFELNYSRLTLASESEYFFDLDEKQNNFYYNWSDLSYSITDWLWSGVSVQRTRAYSTSLDLQYGLLIGGGYKRWELNTYVYNIGNVETFLMVSISAEF